MTTKELLHELVDELDEQQARETLALLRTRQRASQENVPSFAGLIKSASPTLSRDAKNIVREEMGQPK
ncbi:MAG: hypothetical protein ACREP9_02300 [Candidatus Dormibacteraceae bacterium]